MGLSKIKVLGPGKVKFIHQLDNDGKAYAEDVLVTSDVPGRLDYYESKDGQIGVFNHSFSSSGTEVSGVKFPEE